MKEYKCVLLPSYKASSIIKLGDKLIYFEGNFSSNLIFTYQHLYIISNEEPKSKDWIICNLEVMKCALTMDDNKKIIASTDPSLGLLPITKEFVEEYISRYNAGDIITDVNIDWYLGNEEDENQNLIPAIAIHPKRVKDSWDREEVIALCIKAFNDGREDFIDDTWINKNLY
jgi:hypothetical protein